MVLGGIVSPALAHAQMMSVGMGAGLAQVVDTNEVQSKSVGEVWQTFQQLEPYTLTISMLLVIALLFAGGLLRPGGFAKAGLRDLSSLPAVVFLFSAFVVLLAQSSGPQLLTKVPWVQEQGYTPLQMQAINNSVSYLFAIIAGLGMLFILKRSATTGEGENRSGFGLSPLDFPVGLGCFFLAFPAIRLLDLLGTFAYTQTQGQAPSGVGHGILQKLIDNPNDPWVMALVAGAVIGAPIVEELVYRVFLQGALIKWLKSPWLSIILTAIIFASIHRLNTPPAPWYTLPTLFGVGLTCGIAYERTRRVGVPIMMHMCFNLLNVVLVMIVGSNGPATPV